MAKSYKTSYYILYALIAVIVAVFGLFFLVGYDNFEGALRAPENTGLLMWLMFALSGITFVMFLLGVLKEIATAKKPRLIGALVFVALLVVTYFIASTEPLVLPGNKVMDSEVALRFTEMCLYSIAILFVVTVAVALFSLVKSLAKK